MAEDRLIAVNSRQELIAFRLDGSPLWTNRIATISGPLAGPAIDTLGTSYLTDSGSVLHAIDANGTERSRVPLPSPTPHVPSLDQEGRILLTTSASITIVNTNGTILQQIHLPSPPTQAPVLTAEGNLLVVLNGQLRTYRHSHGLASDAPWPMTRQNPRGSSAPPGAVPPPRTPQVLPVILYGNQVRLHLEPWTRPTGYELWRAEVAELDQAIRILELPVGDSRLQDTNVIPEKTYYYWVRAQNSGGTSEFAGPVATSSLDLPRRWRLTGVGQTPPAIAPSGTIYTTGTDGLKALKSDGSLLWALAGLGGQPVVAADGTLLLHSADQLSSFAPTGTTNWSQANLAPHPTAPSLSAAGLILMPGADQFTAYDSAGQVRWQFTEALSFSSAPSIDVDGTMAWVAANYDLQFRQSDGLSQKISPLESNFSDVSAPPWTPDGKVLIQADSPSGLQAFRRDGTRAWMANSFVPTLSPPAVAADGSIFVRLSLVETPGEGGRPWIVALNPDGTHRWKQRTDSMVGTPVLTANELVLVNGTNSIHAWNVADGQPRWILETQAANRLLSPVFDHDGRLLVASFGALEAYDLGVGPAEAPWPMHRQNSRQSASLERPAGPLKLELKSAESAELHLSVTAPGPAVILLESSNLQQWRRVTALPTAGNATELQIPRTESNNEFYRLVVP